MADEEAEAPPPEEPAAEQPPKEEAGTEAASAEAKAEGAAPKVGDEAVAPDDAAAAPGYEVPEMVPVMEERVLESRLEVASSSEKLLEELESKPSRAVIASPSMTASKRQVTHSIGSLEGRRISARDRRSKYLSRARLALGSAIDIRRGTVMGDAADKKAPRYLNTYKMDSDNPFNPQKVEKILQAVMVEALENLTYDGDKCPKQAKWASMAIRSQVKELEFDRYKIVCLVTIGEKNSQDVIATTRFLWDVERDRYAIFAMENTHVYGIAQCFGIYYE